MNKMIFAAMTVLSLAAQAQQSSSSMSAPAGQTQTTTATLAAAKPAEAKKWSGSITAIYDQTARIKEVTEENDFSKYDLEMHLAAKYKLNKTNTLGVIQRFYWGEYTGGDEGMVAPLNLRVQNVTSGMTAANADVTLLSRLTLPTREEDRRDAGYLGSVTLVPEMNWTLSPKWSTSASLYTVASFYTNGEDTEKPGFDRDYHIFFPSVGASYAFSDKLSASGSIGYSVTRRTRSMARADIVGESIESGVSLAYQATPKVNVSGGINQSMPTLPGSRNPSTGKTLAFEPGNDNNTYTIGARDQTVYEVVGSVAF